MRRENEIRKGLDEMTSVSVLTWQHESLYGTNDFSNLLSANDPDYSLEEVIYYKLVCHMKKIEFPVRISTKA